MFGSAAAHRTEPGPWRASRCYGYDGYDGDDARLLLFLLFLEMPREKEQTIDALAHERQPGGVPDGDYTISMYCYVLYLYVYAVVFIVLSHVTLDNDGGCRRGREADAERSSNRRGPRVRASCRNVTES